jgi:hypothetical protein
MSEVASSGASRPDTGIEMVTASRLRRLGPPVVAIVLYAAVAALAFWPVEPFSRSSLSSCACSDPVQETWFLGWVAYALRHGANPFFTSLLDHPTGVNLALNTTMPLLGVLAAPITWIRGPVAAFNAMMRLSFVVSAASMMFVVRRFTRWWPAAFLAGLLYGFSPFMVGEGNGHLFLTFAPFPPLILLCCYELARRPAHPLRWGLALGLLCVLQYFVSIEVLVTTAICAASVAIVVAARHPRGALRALRDTAGGLGLAAGVCVVALAYPTWYLLRGPQHVVGPPHAVANLAPLKADLLSFVVPTLNERIGPTHLIAIGTAFGGGDRPENGVYLGLLLLVLLAFLVVRFRRDGVVLLGALVAAAGALFALGTPLAVDGHSTGIPLPFDILLHLPVVKGLTALRFGLVEQLGAALVLGVGLARLRTAWASGSAAVPAAAPAAVPAAIPATVAAGATAVPTTSGRRQPRRVELALAAAGAVALVPLLPRYPYPSQGVGLPTYFTTSAVDEIPPGSAVLTYPWDVDPVNEAMLWQAASGMRFAIYGGQDSRPGAGGTATSDVPQLAPGVVQQLFAAGLNGSAPGTGAALPPFDAATTAAIDGFCARWDVQEVVVEPQGVQPAEVVRYLTAALGPPRATGGVDVWPDVPRLLAKKRAP